MIAGAPAPAADPKLRIEITADHLVTLDAHNVQLDALLAEVARQTGLVILARGSLGRRVTLALDRLPLPQALARILRGLSFTMQYFGPTNDSPTTPNRLWVLSRDSAAPTETAAPLATVAGAIGLGKAWVGQDPIASIDALLELAVQDEPRWASELGKAALSNRRAGAGGGCLRAE